jgi:hypothetical protein
MMSERENLKHVGQATWDRIKSISTNQGRDTMMAFSRFALERFLVRMMDYRPGEWCLKGGMVMLILKHQANRPTDDMDLTFLNTMELDKLILWFQQACEVVPAQEDGLTFSVDFRSTKLMREEASNPGTRIFVDAVLNGERRKMPIRFKVDAAWGEIVTPKPHRKRIPSTCPTFFEGPEVLVYPWETVLAEKLHTIMRLGMASTRVKDIHDIIAIKREQEFSMGDLHQAITATFNNRNTPFAFKDPEGLSEAYAEANAPLWKKFSSLKGLTHVTSTLVEAVKEAREFILPVMQSLHDGNSDLIWNPATGWKTQQPAPTIKL